MLLGDARKTLGSALTWHMAAMKHSLLGPTDADRFPSLKLMDGVFKDDHWVIDAAFGALEDWLSRNGGLAAEISRQTGHVLQPGAIAQARERFSAIFLAWEDNEDGSVTAVPMDAAPAARRRYHSLGDAAMNGGVAVSVFDHPIKAVDVYDGVEALDAGLSGLKDLTPIGKRAEYRVAILDGRIVHPPAWPADLLREAGKTASEDPEP